MRGLTKAHKIDAAWRNVTLLVHCDSMMTVGDRILITIIGAISHMRAPYLSAMTRKRVSEKEGDRERNLRRKYYIF